MIKKIKKIIAVVQEVQPQTHVRFLKHVKGTCTTFINPPVDDFSDVDQGDIVKVLSEPSLDKKCHMIFDVDVNLWP